MVWHPLISLQHAPAPDLIARLSRQRQTCSILFRWKFIDWNTTLIWNDYSFAEVSENFELFYSHCFFLSDFERWTLPVSLHFFSWLPHCRHLFRYGAVYFTLTLEFMFCEKYRFHVSKCIPYFLCIQQFYTSVIS